LSGTSDGHLRRWKVETQPLSLTKVDDFANLNTSQYSISFSSDYQWVASGGKNSLVYVWDAKNRKLLYSLPGHNLAIVRVIFSQEDRQQLVTAGVDNTIKVWDLGQKQELFTLPLPTRKRGGDGWDFDFRCFPEKCWIVVPLTQSNKLIGYELGKIYE